jgi:hypothetical protein
MSMDEQQRFDALQAQLVPLWHSIHALSDDEQTIVVVPSLSLHLVDTSHIPLQAYEERLLFLLLLLRQPRARLVYVTSQPILPGVIDYYLGLLPGVIPSHARARLFPVAVLDASPRPLSEKLLERPRLLDRIRSLVPDPRRAHLVPFNTSILERDLALALGIPMYGADPRFLGWGTKSGCRRLFAEEGVSHPAGAEGLRSLDDVVDAIVAIRAAKPSIEQVLVKLDDGVSGDGNARVDLRELPDPGVPHEREATRRAVEGMRLEAAQLTVDDFLSELAHGGIVEERVAGEAFASPSVQMRVTPLGELELLSTHDQLLGGPSGQAYVGCVFPADPAYAALITGEAARIGRRLAREGVIGRFAVDFVVVRNPSGEWESNAIEINLRKGGTTHPFLTLQFLTDGTYDPVAAVFTAPSGRAKYFVASDRVESPEYRGFSLDDLFDVVVRNGLHFDHARQTGIVLHMMAALTETGRVGMTAVGDSPADARALYERAVAVLDREAAGGTAVVDPASGPFPIPT